MTKDCYGEMDKIGPGLGKNALDLDLQDCFLWGFPPPAWGQILCLLLCEADQGASAEAAVQAGPGPTQRRSGPVGGRTYGSHPVVHVPWEQNPYPPKDPKCKVMAWDRLEYSRKARQEESRRGAKRWGHQTRPAEAGGLQLCSRSGCITLGMKLVATFKKEPRKYTDLQSSSVHGVLLRWPRWRQATPWRPPTRQETFGGLDLQFRVPPAMQVPDLVVFGLETHTLHKNKPG